MRPMHVYAARHDPWGYCGLLFSLGEQGGKRRDVAPVEFTVVERDGDAFVGEPTLRLPDETAQRLMQALWDVGYRPNNGAGSSAESDALRKHIQFAEHVTDSLLGTLRS